MNPTIICIHKKPVAIRKKTVARLTGAPLPAASYEETAIDFEAALKRVMGDEDFLWELFREFIKELPCTEKTLFEAIDRKDTSTIIGQARRLKSAAGNLGAMRLSDAALKLEQIGRKGNINRADKALNRLLMEANRMISYIERIVSFPMKIVAVS